MDKKKLSAAIAAVFTYMKTSEEALAQYAPQVSGSDLLKANVQSYNNWGMTGRLNQMQANSMMQMRMFK
ncbi:MAG: hypothetical protein ABIJ59_15975 [Pseudomonadota bacterium]